MTEQRPLVIVRDEQLLDEVLRIAAASGCEVDCVLDFPAAGAYLARAPLVIVDQEVLARAEPEGIGRRRSVLLVCTGPPDPVTWQRAFSCGVGHVVVLPSEEAVLCAMFADLLEGPSARGRVLAVIGGRGGAGASVLAAGVAISACRAGGSALLVDCDGLGGGLDLVLGAELKGGLRWPDLTLNAGRVSMSALAEALPDPHYDDGRLVVLSCDRSGPGPTSEGIASVIDAGARVGRTVVCDLPRDLGEAGLRVIDRADLVVVVLPAEVRASAAAKRVAEQLRDRARRVGVVVRGPAPDALPAGAVAEAVGLPVVAVMRAEPKLGRALDRAEFDLKAGGPLAKGARTVLDALWSDEPVYGAA